MKYQLPDGRIVEPNQAFTYNGIQYPANWTQLASPEEISALGMVEYIDPPSPPVVPSVVSMRQARLALLAGNLLDSVEAAVSSAGRAAQIEWEFASDVRRDWPLLISLASQLGLTPAQVDDLFISAASL